MLAIQHFGDEYAGVGDEVPPRLAQQREPGLLDRRRHGVGEVARTRRLLGVVAHAQSPAHIQRFDRADPRGSKRRHQIEQLDGAAVLRLDVGVLKVLKALGAGAALVSVGGLQLALAAGFDAGSIPAASARRSSPTETMSAPAPIALRTFRTPMLPLAFTEKQMRCDTSFRASCSAWYWARIRLAL